MRGCDMVVPSRIVGNPLNAAPEKVRRAPRSSELSEIGPDATFRGLLERRGCGSFPTLEFWEQLIRESAPPELRTGIVPATILYRRRSCVSRVFTGDSSGAIHCIF